MSTATRAPQHVGSLELFFDLVFVFTITQLTRVLDEHPDAGGLLRVALMLGVICWMYGGYAWLTNAVDMDNAARRLLLLGGTAGYLVLALAVPRAFEGSGTAFGLSYLAIVLVHVTLFLRSSSTGVVHAILRVAPLFVVAVLVQDLSPIRTLGQGADGLPIDGSLVAVAVLGLALSACLWWAYFGGDDAGAERAPAGSRSTSRRTSRSGACSAPGRRAGGPRRR